MSGALTRIAVSMAAAVAGGTTWLVVEPSARTVVADLVGLEIGSTWPFICSRRDRHSACRCIDEYASGPVCQPLPLPPFWRWLLRRDHPHHLIPGDGDLTLPPL